MALAVVDPKIFWNPDKLHSLLHIRLFHATKIDFYIRKGGPHVSKGMWKIQFSHAVNAVACENPFLAYGRLSRPHMKRKNREKNPKIKNYTETLTLESTRRHRHHRPCPPPPDAAVVVLLPYRCRWIHTGGGHHQIGAGEDGCHRIGVGRGRATANESGHWRTVET